nr:hypothetical protein [Tanacetum cinerariifolium]
MNPLSRSLVEPKEQDSHSAESSSSVGLTAAPKKNGIQGFVTTSDGSSKPLKIQRARKLNGRLTSFRDCLQESVSHLPIRTDFIILILVLSSLVELDIQYYTSGKIQLPNGSVIAPQLAKDDGVFDDTVFATKSERDTIDEGENNEAEERTTKEVMKKNCEEQKVETPKEIIVEEICKDLVIQNNTTMWKRMLKLLILKRMMSCMQPKNMKLGDCVRLPFSHILSVYSINWDFITGLLFQSIPEDLDLQIRNLKTGKEMWEAIKTHNLGADRVKEARLQILITEFENMNMLDNGTIDEYAAKLSGIASKSSVLGEIMSKHKLVKKFLTSLSRRFIHIVAALDQLLDLKTTGFEDVVGRLKANEERVKEEDKENDPQENLLYARMNIQTGMMT